MKDNKRWKELQSIATASRVHAPWMGRRRARTTPSQHRSVRSSTGRHIGCACPTMPNADRADCGTARRHARASRLAPVRVSRTYIPHSCRRCVTVIVYPHRRHGRAVYVLVRSRCAAAGPAGAAPSAETAGGSPGRVLSICEVSCLGPLGRWTLRYHFLHLFTY